jgi:hypothetical protein
MRLYHAACSCILVATSFLFAESKNPADYPLRIHIFGRDETNWYRFHAVEDSRGEGRANLFENNQVHGLDFNFDCAQKLKSSFGYETYPARWKKPGKELVVLLPVFGKTGSYFTCDLNTDMKDFTYFRHNGNLESEPMEQFQAWMVRHDYDPIHGKDVPLKTQPGDGTQAPPPPPDAPPPPSQ